MLAKGGLLPVVTPTLMGIGFILTGWFVDPLFGVAPTLGILMLITAAFFANFGEIQTVPYLETKESWSHLLMDTLCLLSARGLLEDDHQNLKWMTARKMNIQELGSPNPARISYHSLLSKDSRKYLQERSLKLMFGE